MKHLSLLLLPLLLPACSHDRPLLRMATVEEVTISEDVWADGSTTAHEVIRCRDENGKTLIIHNCDPQRFGQHKPGQRVELPAPPDCKLPYHISPHP